jgi:hypothetical protein
MVSKLYMRWIRDVLHQRIITIEQIPLDGHRGECWVIKLFRQPETKQGGGIASQPASTKFNL